MWNVYCYSGDVLMIQDCGSQEQAWKYVRLLDEADDFQFYHYAQFVEV